MAFFRTLAKVVSNCTGPVGGSCRVLARLLGRRLRASPDSPCRNVACCGRAPTDRSPEPFVLPALDMSDFVDLHAITVQATLSLYISGGPGITPCPGDRSQAAFSTAQNRAGYRGGFQYLEILCFEKAAPSVHSCPDTLCSFPSGRLWLCGFLIFRQV